MVLTRVGDQRTPWSLCTLLNCLQSRLLQHDLKLGKYFLYVECFNAFFFLALDISVLDNFKVGNRNKLYFDIGNASKQKVGVYSLNFLVQFPLKETGRQWVAWGVLCWHRPHLGLGRAVGLQIESVEVGNLVEDFFGMVSLWAKCFLVQSVYLLL